MDDPLVHNLLAALALAPATLWVVWGRPVKSALFWGLFLLAAAGPLIICIRFVQVGWQTGFAAALWVTIAGCLLAFLMLSAVTRNAHRLSCLLMPYLLILSLSAAVWGGTTAETLQGQPPAWIVLHIATSVLTYVLLTLAAIAGASVVIHEGALRRKKRFPILDRLPSSADSERLELRLLLASEAVLGLGIISGMAVQYLLNGAILSFDHKTLFSFLAFAVIGVLLIAHYRVGVRGRQAARIVLVGYLLITLGYPGVKFVTDILIA